MEIQAIWALLATIWALISTFLLKHAKELLQCLEEIVVAYEDEKITEDELFYIIEKCLQKFRKCQ